MDPVTIQLQQKRFGYEGALVKSEKLTHTPNGLEVILRLWKDADDRWWMQANGKIGGKIVSNQASASVSAMAGAEEGITANLEAAVLRGLDKHVETDIAQALA